jgi:signal peptidase I
MDRALPFLFGKLALAFLLGVVAADAGGNGLVADPSAKVGLATALADARRLAAGRGDTVLRVEGRSMLPYFGDGSVLVLRATPVEALREGMVVVYRNRFGETIAHRIEARSRDGGGWVVRGANNADADSTLVTGENLVGVVYVTLYSDPRGAETTVRLAGVEGAGVAVALAAPAR